MNQFKEQLQDLYNRIPRRHTAENLQEINSIINDYEEILGRIESLNPWYEKNTASFYPSLEQIRGNIKSSNSNKHAKKAKDGLFDEASGSLKDDIQSLIAVYDAGTGTA
jgi:hypothetical protein